MPIYGAAKRRNMIRSVLPSSRYTSARADKRAVNRALRRTVNRAVDVLDWDDDLGWDLADCSYSAIAVAEGWYRRDMHEIVWERRQGDKAAALERWAPHQVAHLPVEDRLSRMAAMLPDSTVGRHALDHLRFLPEFGAEPRRWWDLTDADRQAAWARRDRAAFIGACRYASVRARLLWVWDHDLIDVFNAEVATVPDVARGGADDPGYPPVGRRNVNTVGGLVDGGGIDQWLTAVLHRGWRDRREHDLPTRMEAWLFDATSGIYVDMS